MKQHNLITFFKIVCDRINRENLLNSLSQFGYIHIRSKSIAKEGQPEEKSEILEKITELKNLENTLFTKLDINVQNFYELKIKKNERLKFEFKNLRELIDYLTEELKFFVNRVKELERYISNAKIELENKELIKSTYRILENFNLNRNSLSNFKNLDFKVYTTYLKNLSNLHSVFEFSEFPCVYEISKISSDRIVFFIIFLKENEKKLRERISFIHAEEVPILLKYLTNDGINFARINREIDLIEKNLENFQKEFERIRAINLHKFAAIYEVLSNIEKYYWADQQFETISSDKVAIKFFAPLEEKEQIKHHLQNSFNEKILIQSIDIPKHPKLYKKERSKKTVEEQRIEEIKKEQDDLYENSNLLEEEYRDKDLRGETPTIMKHNRFIRPFETLTRMYGTPSYSEIDPTPFLFITFPLIFGLMFGDIGHGFILVIAGLLGSKIFKEKGGDIYNFCWIIFYCGLWAILIGFLYGEFFGTEQFFGLQLHPFTIPILNITLYKPLNNIITIFVFTLFIGIIHINLGWI
ncbi:MAG: V-type ATPase 116kDa subunit family protein, partial [Promethearchaeota archaeon]